MTITYLKRARLKAERAEAALVETNGPPTAGLASARRREKGRAACPGRAAKSNAGTVE